MSRMDNLSRFRMLVVSERPYTLRLLRQVLDIVGIRQLISENDISAAVGLMRSTSFTAVFCDYGLGELDTEAFAYTVRRSSDVLNPMIPIFLVCSGPNRNDVELARDTGFNDVLALPLSAKTVLRKLQFALDKPPAFIVSAKFFGPDRRRSISQKWPGGDRRKRQPRRVAVKTQVDTDCEAE
jgi:two-component system chemotaxis response regulator CheY